MTNDKLTRAIKLALLGAGAAGLAVPVLAQEETAPENLEQIVVTGTRIAVPGLESSSRIYSVGEADIELQQQPAPALAVHQQHLRRGAAGRG